MYNENQIEYNNEILESFNINAIKKRLKNELDKMYNDTNQIIVELNNPGQKDDVVLYVYIYEIDGENQMHSFKFGITLHYPFRPPKIYYQGYPYIDFLQISRTEKELSLFKKVTGLNCLCCNSYNCSDNWSPAVLLVKIINEIKYIRRKKRDVINKLIADKIKKKYLIDDIDLDCWLWAAEGRR
jgi:ubiquitin-protein ligase